MATDPNLYQANDWSNAVAPASDWSHLSTDPLSAGSSSWASSVYGPYGYAPSTGGPGSYDPAYSSNTMYDPYSGFTTRGIQADVEHWLQKEYPELFDFETGNVNSGFGGQPGDVSQNPSFGQFSKDPTVFGEIAAAAAKHGVPANLLKVMIARESSGDWNANSHATYLASRGERIVGYTGIMESTARAWGYDFDQLVGNRGLQIDAMAKGLSLLYEDVGGEWGWDGVIATYYSGDPSQNFTPPDSYQYGTTQEYVADVNSWWDGEDAWTVSNGGQTWSAETSGLTDVESAYWEPVNQWNPQIANASNQYGVPPNLLKAIMRVESQGIPTAINEYSGATGLMQIMPNMHGATQQQLLDPVFNINKSAEILRNSFDQTGSWNTATQRYLGIGVDAMGTSNTEYWDMVSRYWQELDAAGSGMFGGEASADAGPIMAAEAAWGGLKVDAKGKPIQLSQDHGPGAFANANPGWYSYSRDLLGGELGHPGIDVGMAEGTALYAPAGGTVIIAGPESGFQIGANMDDTTPGTGQLRIRMNNGHEVILGHMAGIYVQPGDRVNPGQLVGVSGFAGTGAHLHLEYRIPNQAFNGGWEAVDPREALAGIYQGGFTGTTAQAGITRRFTYEEIVQRAAQGLPIDFGATLGDGGTSWNSWLQSSMTGAIPNRRNDPAATGFVSQRDPRTAGQAQANPWAIYSMGR